MPRKNPITSIAIPLTIMNAGLMADAYRIVEKAEQG
jgi:hypothetical protein